MLDSICSIAQGYVEYYQLSMSWDYAPYESGLAAYYDVFFALWNGTR
jgi:hypothetical protein